MSKEKMLEQAKEVKPSAVNVAYNENKARAEDDYLNKIIKISGYVGKIETDYITISNFRIYLDADVLKSLNWADKITVVGKITKMSSETNDNSTTNVFEMKNAYFVESLSPIGNVVVNFTDHCLIKDVDTDVLIDVYFDSSILGDIRQNDIITIDGKITMKDSIPTYNTTSGSYTVYWEIKNAQLVQKD